LVFSGLGFCVACGFTDHPSVIGAVQNASVQLCREGCAHCSPKTVQVKLRMRLVARFRQSEVIRAS
jgi:hypothetical protein